MPILFSPASRTNTIPLICLYGLSGTGKTMSSLLIARGLVGEVGKIAMIDTESGRGSLYADVIPGGYDTASLEPPFTAQRYVEAITQAEQAKYGVVVVDSVSHEWEGQGGVLDQASAEEARTGKKGLHIWTKPKMNHQKLILKLLQAKVPIICCLRAKYKSRQVGKGKDAEIVRDDYASPIQDENFIYESTAHAEILQDHTLRLTKCSHPDLRACFDNNPPTVETGAKIAHWARGGESDIMTNVSKPSLEKVAEDVASLGLAAFRRHWQSLTPMEQRALEPIKDKLKEQATEVDASRSTAEETIPNSA